MVNEIVPADYSSMELKEALEFDTKIKANMLPAFPAVVRQIIDNCNILDGICVEIGSGTALLSIELAKNTNLTIYAMEKSPAMFEVGIRNIKESGLENRINSILGDAHTIPFEDEFADLVVSRGSYHFWEDKPRVFTEILRVLKKGGVAFIGGGFGSGHNKTRLKTMLDIRDRSLGDAALFYRSPAIMKENLSAAQIHDYHIIFDDTGLWAIIRKQEAFLNLTS